MGYSASYRSKLHTSQTFSISATRLRDAEERFQRFCGSSASFGALDPRAASEVKLTNASLVDVSLARFSLTNVAIRPTLQNFVSVVAHLRGTARIVADTARHELCDPTTIALRPSSRVLIEAPKRAANVLMIPVATLKRHAEQLTNEPASDAMIDRINTEIGRQSAVGAELNKMMELALSYALDPNLAAYGPLAAAGYRELLLSFAAGALLPEVWSRYSSETPDCGPYIVRRAREYVDARAAEPISLAELAHELGVSARSLQQHFKNAYGVSLRDYLTERRLELAHGLLTTGDAAMSVTEAALASGFSDLGHFATKYRARFGRSPREALSAARRL